MYSTYHTQLRCSRRSRESTFLRFKYPNVSQGFGQISTSLNESKLKSRSITQTFEECGRTIVLYLSWMWTGQNKKRWSLFLSQPDSWSEILMRPNHSRQHSNRLAMRSLEKSKGELKRVNYSIVRKVSIIRQQAYANNWSLAD